MLQFWASGIKISKREEHSFPHRACALVRVGLEIIQYILVTPKLKKHSLFKGFNV